jgi:hypothetical protein
MTTFVLAGYLLKWFLALLRMISESSWSAVKELRGSCFGHLFEAGKGLFFWQLILKKRVSMGGG